MVQVGDGFEAGVLANGQAKHETSRAGRFIELVEIGGNFSERGLLNERKKFLEAAFGEVFEFCLIKERDPKNRGK